MAIIYEAKTREDMLMKNIEHQIRTNQFSNIEELKNYLLELKNKGLSKLTAEQEKSLLELFDTINLSDMNYGNLQNTTSNDTKKADNHVEQDKILQFTDALSENKQNSTNPRELVALSDVVYIDKVDKDLLYKVRFFITNSNMQLNSFAINLSNNTFHDTETSEEYEVRQHPEEKKQYIIVNKTEELKLLKTDVKTKKLSKPSPTNMQNAAFTRVGFLIINILTFVILTVMIILLNK